MWQHDMYNGPGKTLSSRLTDPSSASSSAGGGGGPRKVETSLVQNALRQATAAGSAAGGGGGLSIKGSASQNANVVEVAGLVSGTTAADVEAIFKRCGHIVKSVVHSSSGNDVIVRLTFKKSDDARNAVTKFNGLPADGRILRVSVVGSANASLGGRLGGDVLANGTVDVLMDGDDSDSGGSKMRSDDVLRTDPRAQVLTVPPGANPADYQQARGGGRGAGGGRRRGGRRGGGGGRGGSNMQLD
ncbi:hypothetical protein BD410DRAFT_620632 [Rickenella mellea]|uniref:RRM domain-containing protein n=2 Tax=Rickenella mellea TaxID=50990 RepID=A0A4Y7PMU3_9AGAM|nr:hypothetical protein BD410DRAFT_620632 [Rickenella mellea]